MTLRKFPERYLTWLESKANKKMRYFMELLLQVAWAVFIFLVIDKQIANVINQKYKIYRHFRGSEHRIGFGFGVSLLSMLIVSLLVSSILPKNGSESLLSGCIFVTFTSLIFGTVVRTVFRF